MSLHTRRKPAVLLVLLLALAGMGAAVTDGIHPSESKTVWLNHDRMELNATCAGSSVGSANLSFFDGDTKLDSILKDNFTDKNSSLFKPIGTEFFDDKYDSAGTATVKLSCGGSHVETTEIPVRTFEVSEDIGHGEGFVGERFGDSGITDADLQPITVDVGTGVSGSTASDFETGDFSFAFSGDQSHEISKGSGWAEGAKRVSEDGTVTLKPFIEGYLDEFDLEITYKPGKEAVTESVTVEPQVFDWRVTSFAEDGKPGPVIEYADLGEAYEYELSIENVNPDIEEEYLYKPDFALTVLESDGDEVSGMENKQWLDVTHNDDGSYTLTLDNIPDLGTGTYTFELKVRPEEATSEAFVVDTVRVVNALKFEGRVRDANGRGVETEMTLFTNDDQTVPVVTDSNGRYAKDLSTPNIDSAELRFFYRERSAPDAFVTVEDPELAEQSEVGQTSASIGFHYWTDPPVEVSGLNPTDMMAVKFAHDIDGASASMAFDPANIDPTELEVYECTDWNFLGMECMGRWSRMSDNDVSLNYDSWTAHLSDLDRHEVPENVGGSAKDILMNAYVAGVPSALTLEGDRPLTVSGVESGNRIAAGEEFTVSGTVVTTEGDTVADANVTLDLVGPDGVAEPFTATTDIGGGFAIEAEAPSDTGTYTLRVDITKDQYTAFTYDSADSGQTIDVYYTTGLSLDMPDLPTLHRGETTELDVGIENTGQTAVSAIEVDLAMNDIPSQYVSVTPPQELSAGGSADATLTVDLPADFCPQPCNSPPRITVTARGDVDGETVEATGQMFTRVEGGNGTGQDTSGQQDAEQQPDEPDGTAFSPGSAVAATGEFIRRQSDVNLALGLILVFTVALAVAVRKRNTGRDVMDDRVRHGRIDTPQVRPDDRSPPGAPAAPVTGGDDDAGGDDAETGGAADDDAADDASGQADADADDVYVCEETGETFDTKDALEMYREIHDLD